MKKTILLIISLVVIVFIMTGCAGKSIESVKSEETQVMAENGLLSVEDFISLSGISADKYADIDLEAFIKDYEITAEDIKTLNIELLLDEYKTISAIMDVNSILEEPEITRTADFTEDVVAIAFYENINTGIDSVYYDVENGFRYQMDQGFVFDDLNSGVKTPIDNVDELLSELEANDVFTWSSVSKNEEINDSQSMVLAIEYSDGSRFRVSASGILSKVLPSAYSTVKELLLGK